MPRELPGSLGEAAARRARGQKGIRAKSLRFFDSMFEKQQIAARQKQIVDDFRHHRGSGGEEALNICS
jgi:hypothetical protein